MAWNFDIRSRVKNPNQMKFQHTYVTVNLMCNLLDTVTTAGDDLTYRRIFREDLDEVVQAIINKVDEKVDPNTYYIDTYLDRTQRAQLRDRLVDIKDLSRRTQVPDPSNPGNDVDIRFHDLYTAARGTDTMPTHAGARGVWKGFRDLHNAFGEFCLPFVEFSQGKTAHFMDVMLDGGVYQGVTYLGIGNVKVRDLYTKTLAELAQLALVPPEAEDYSEKKLVQTFAATIRTAQMENILVNNYKKPNDQCCDGTGCTSMPNSQKFCSEADTGGCSAQSDTC